MISTRNWISSYPVIAAKPLIQRSSYPVIQFSSNPAIQLSRRSR